jgi:hypothetical protein
MNKYFSPNILTQRHEGTKEEEKFENHALNFVPLCLRVKKFEIKSLYAIFKSLPALRRGGTV